VTPLFVATGDAVMRVAEGRAAAVLEEPGAQCAAVDARNPERVLAGCRAGGVFESEDGGTTWRNADLPASDVFSVAYSPADGAAYAGCEPSAVWARRNGDWEELPALRELPSAPNWSFPPRPVDVSRPLDRSEPARRRGRPRRHRARRPHAHV
jgi:hypothetical protein